MRLSTAAGAALLAGSLVLSAGGIASAHGPHGHGPHGPQQPFGDIWRMPAPGGPAELCAPTPGIWPSRGMLPQLLGIRLGWPGDGRLVCGTFVSQTGGTITLAAGPGGNQQTYTLSQDAKVTEGGQPSSLSSFQVGDTVLLALDGAGDAQVVQDVGPAPLQRPHPGAVTGTVTRIGDGTVTLDAGVQPVPQGDDHDGDRGPGMRPGALGSGTYALNPRVRVVVRGEGDHGALQDVQPGDVVRLVVGPQGLVDRIIVLRSAPAGGGVATAPANLAVQETASGVALTFSGVSGAAGYQVLEAAGGGYSPVASAEGGTPAGTGTTITGLAPGTTYTFEVEVQGTGTASAPSAAIEWGGRAAQTARVSVVPYGSAAYATIAVAYDRPLNPATLDTATALYSVTDLTTHAALGVASVEVSGSTLTVTTLPYLSPASSTDVFELTTAQSVVDDAAGAPTTPIAATGSATTAIPSGLTTQETAGGVYLRWTAVPGATAYQVLEAAGGAYAPVSAADGGTPGTDATAITGLASGTTYTFEVEVLGQASPSSPSGAIEWGTRPSPGATVTMTQVAGEEALAIAVSYDRPLDAGSLDGTLSDYTVTDLTAHRALAVASVSLVGQTLIVQTQLAAPVGASDEIVLTTSRSVVNDQVGAPSAPIDATGVL